MPLNYRLNQLTILLSSIESLVGLGGNLRALMQANEISSEFDTKLFDTYAQKYNSLSNDQLINEFNIPEDRIDIIPNALNIYSYIIKETKAKVISNSFWSISDGLAQKLIREEF